MSQSDKLYSVEAFAAGIKKNYPEYKDVEDQELVGQMLEKYPEFKNKVDYTSLEESVYGKKKESSTVSESVGGQEPIQSVLPEQPKKIDYANIVDNNPNELQRLWNRSIAQSEVGKMISRSEYGGSIDFDELAYLQNVLKENAVKDDDYLYDEDYGVIGNFALDLMRVIPESLISFGSSMASPEAAAAGATGAAIGSVVPVIGTGIGASAGAAFAASSMSEYGNTIIAKLQEEGVNVYDSDELSAAFQNEDLMSAVKTKAAGRAGVVGALDALSAGVAGKISKSAAMAGYKVATRELAEQGVEGALGGLGEALGAVAAGDEISAREVLLEALADPAQGLSGRAIKSVLGKNADPEENALLDRFEENPEKTGNLVKVVSNTNEEIIEINDEIKSLESVKESSQTPQQKGAIQKRINKLKKEKTKQHLSAISELEGATDEESKQFGEMVDEISALAQTLQNPELSEQQREPIKKAMLEKHEEVKALKEQVKSRASEPVTTEAKVISAEEADQAVKEAEAAAPVTTEAQVIDAKEADSMVEAAEAKAPKEVEFNGEMFNVTEEGEVTRVSSGRKLKKGSKNYKGVMAAMPTPKSTPAPKKAKTPKQKVAKAPKAKTKTQIPKGAQVIPDGDFAVVRSFLKQGEEVVEWNGKKYKFGEGETIIDADTNKQVVGDGSVTAAETPASPTPAPEAEVQTPETKPKPKSKKKAAPVAEETKVEEVKAEEPKKPEVKKQTVKETKAEKQRKKRAERISKEVPRSKYTKISSPLVRTETGYTTVIEKKDKRSGKVRRYEGDVILDFKTGKVRHVVTEYLDGKEQKVTEYDTIKSFRDSINKKVKDGAKVPSSFQQQYESQVRTSDKAALDRAVPFEGAKKEEVKEGRVVVEKITYEAADGSQVEIRLQDNGKNRQKGLPRATVVYPDSKQPKKTFATKQQLDDFRSQLARRKKVNVETISDTVRKTDQNVALSEDLNYTSDQILPTRKTTKKRVSTKRGKPKNLKPYTMSTYFKDQQITIIQYKDKRGNAYLYQRLPDSKSGEFKWFEVKEETLQGGVKRFNEVGKGFEQKRDIVSKLRADDKAAAETDPTPPPTKAPKPKAKRKQTKPAVKKSARKPINAPTRAEIDAKVAEAEKMRATGKETVLIVGKDDLVKRYGVFGDGTIINEDTGKEVKRTGALGKKILKEQAKKKTEAAPKKSKVKKGFFTKLAEAEAAKDEVNQSKYSTYPALKKRMGVIALSEWIKNHPMFADIDVDDAGDYKTIFIGLKDEFFDSNLDEGVLISESYALTPKQKRETGMPSQTVALREIAEQMEKRYKRYAPSERSSVISGINTRPYAERKVQDIRDNENRDYGFTHNQKSKFVGTNTFGTPVTAFIAVARNAQMLLNRLSFGGVKPKLYFVRSEADFRAAMDKYSQQGSIVGAREQARMITNKLTGDVEIYVNLEYAKPHTVAHEVFHAYFANIFNQDPTIAEGMAERIEKVLSTGNKAERQLAAELKDFTSNYREGLQAEEFLAEFAGRLSDNLGLLEDTMLEKIVKAIKEFIYETAQSLGLNIKDLKKMEAAAARRDAQFDLEFIAGFAQAMSLTEEDLSLSFYDDIRSESEALRIIRNSILDRDGSKVSYGNIESKMLYEYTEDSDIVQEMVENGDITFDHDFMKEVKGKPIMMHQPDRAFTGIIKKAVKQSDGSFKEVVLVKGMGGLYYPINFAKDGFFWASTESAAKDMAKKLNQVRAASPDGKIRFVLNLGNREKAFSSTVTSNGVLDVFFNLAEDDKYGVSQQRIAEMAKTAVLEGMKIKDLSATARKSPIEVERRNQLNGILEKLRKATTTEEIMPLVRATLNPEFTTFDNRKEFLTRATPKGTTKPLGFVNQFVQELSGNEKAAKVWSEVLDLSGLKDAGLSKTDKLNSSNVREALTRMFNEPILNSHQDENMSHVILEIDSDVEAFQTDPNTDSHHPSYPFSLKIKDGEKSVRIKFLSESVNPFKGVSMYDPNKGTDFKYQKILKKDSIEVALRKDYLNRLMAGKVMPSTAGVSQPIVINGTKSQKARIQEVVGTDAKTQKKNKKEYLDIADGSQDADMKRIWIEDKAKTIAASKDNLSKKKADVTPEEMQRFIPAAEKALEAKIKKIKGIQERSSMLSPAEQQALDEKAQIKTEKNRVAKVRSIKDILPFFSSLYRLGQEKGLFYTENQKKILQFQEAMSSQLSKMYEDIDTMGQRLRKLTKTTESLKLVESYLTASPDTKQEMADQILALPKGDKILAVADGMRVMIDSLSERILNDPNFDSLPEKAFKQVESYKVKDKSGNSVTKYKVVNTKTNQAIAMDLSKAKAEELAQADGIKDVIRNNLGTYLHTSYRFFKDKKFKITDKAVKQAIEGEYELAKKAKIEEFMKGGMTAEEAVAAVADAKVINELMDAARDSIRNYVAEIRAMREAPSYIFSGVSAASVKIPKSVFQRKKGVPEHIQKLLGVEKDPVLRFADTAMAMSKTIYKTQMVARISEALGEDYVLDSVTDEQLNSGNWKKVKDQYSPLNGKYVRTEVFEMLDSKPLLQSENALVNGYFKALKLQRKSKVIWNLPTWRKNLTGGWFFIAANGYVNPEFVKDLKRRMERVAKGESDPQIEELLREMAEFGMIGADVNANLIDLNDAAMNLLLDEDPSKAEANLKKAFRKAKRFDSKLAQKYASVDDYTKLIIYRNEKRVFARKLYGAEYDTLTDSQKQKVKEAAAEYVKQNTPTFSRLPKWYVKSFAKFPLGDFLGFKLESYRSITANINNAFADLKKAREDGLTDIQKQAYKKAGLSRLSGSIATLSARAVVPAMLAALWLDDEDEEVKDDATLLRPSWMEGHSLIVKSIGDDGTVEVYNYSMEDPYGEVTDLLLGDFGTMNDFMKPNMFVKLAVQLAEGKDAYGRDLYDKSDPAIWKLGSILGYTTKSMIIPPSVASSVKYQENQLLIRDYKFNVGQQFYFAAREYTKGKPYYELKGNARANRLRSLDEVRAMYEAVMKIGVAKNNAKLIVNANKVLNRFNKVERAYIRSGQEVSFDQ